MQPLRGLVLDVDGTLADTEEVHRLAFNEAFSEFKLDWHWDQALYARLLAISGGRERIRHYALERGSVDDDSTLARFCLNLHQRKTAIYQEMLEAGTVPLRPGVRRLIDEARHAGLRLALATSTARGNVDRLLDRQLPAEWRTWFDAIVSCDEVNMKKPSPAVYIEALRRLDLPARACVAVEDTVNGLNAARAAGLKTIVTTHVFTRECEFPGAALVVDSLGEPGRPCITLASKLGEVSQVTVSVLRRAVQPAIGPRYRFHSSASYAAAV